MAMRSLGSRAKAWFAVGGAGQLQHQVLVVVQAEPDGADRDALAEQAPPEDGELRGTAGADVGLAVRQQHDAVEAAGIQVAAYLLGALADAIVDVGLPARTDLADAVEKQRGVRSQVGPAPAPRSGRRRSPRRRCRWAAGG